MILLEIMKVLRKRILIFISKSKLNSYLNKKFRFENFLFITEKLKSACNFLLAQSAGTVEYTDCISETPPLFHEKDATQGSFLIRIQLIWIQKFSFHRQVCPNIYPYLGREGEEMNLSLSQNHKHEVKH